ncbi:unnamed protein product, partial [Sphenostylis stenocarpa]
LGVAGVHLGSINAEIVHSLVLYRKTKDNEKFKGPMEECMGWEMSNEYTKSE